MRAGALFTFGLVLLLTPRAIFAQGGPPPPPPPLAAPQAPPGNPTTLAKINLGKVLFWDEQLSSTRTVSCGTCHIPTAGGSDPRSVVGGAFSTHPGADGEFGTDDDAVGSPGVPLNHFSGAYEWEASFGIREQVTGRKSPPALNAGYSPELFWDGRAAEEFRDPVTDAVVLTNGAALESQALGPPVSSTEMGHIDRDWTQAAARMAESKPLALSPDVPEDLETWIGGRGYPELFEEAFGEAEVQPARIAMAMASYERSLYTDQTPFNALLAGNPMALTPLENQGRQVFGQKGCGVCHAGNRLTDDIYHYTGVRPPNEDLGRFEVTGNPPDRGAFKTPGLLNVELRGPFFHNGQFETLEDVIDFYDRGGDFDAPNKAPGIVPLNMTQQEKDALAAFLRRPLTDPRVAAGTAPFDRPTLYAESDRVPQATGQGVGGSGGFIPAAVAVEPPMAGNPSFTAGVYGALGGAAATLVIDESDPGEGPAIPASGSLARIETTLLGSGAGQGYGTASVAIPNDDPDLIGAEVFGRWYVADPQAPGGVAVSAAFRMTIFGEAVETSEGGFSGFVIR